MTDAKPKAPAKRSRKAKPPDPDLQAAAEAGAAAAAKPRDEPPAPVPGGGEGRKRRRRSKSQTTKAIADALAELLCLPAVPCAIVGDQPMAEHFSTQGREFAERIANVSERNETLRRWCERALEGESVAVLLFGAVAYAGPPLIHWGIIPGGGLGSAFGISEPAPAPETVAGNGQPDQAAPPDAHTPDPSEGMPPPVAPA